MNQGQICMSTERIIVVESVADEFAAKFKAKVESMPVGDPVAGNTPLGAVVDVKTVDHCKSLIDDAVAKGAELLTGGETTSNVLMPAHLVDKVTPDMKLFRDESFGPVVGMIRARDTEHAVALANDTQYGLSAAVFTRDIAKGLVVAKQIQSGICHINSSTVSDEPQMPFGGVKASGYGRFGGKAGIDSFTELRWITVSTGPGHYPI
jgi:acyl-CoA reductase-like NAD-dependent aldehyde dehydrogenase